MPGLLLSSLMFLQHSTDAKIEYSLRPKKNVNFVSQEIKQLQFWPNLYKKTTNICISE